MTDIAIRVENYILSRVEGCILSRVEGLSQLYPSTALRTGHIGRAQQRHDTLRDAMSKVGSRMSNVFHRRDSTFQIRDSTFQIRDSTFQIRDSTFQIRHLLKILSRITEPTAGRVTVLADLAANEV